MKKISILYIEFLKDTAANHLLMMIKGMTNYKDYNLVCLCQKNSFIAGELKAFGIKHIYELEYKIINNKFLLLWQNIQYLYLLFYIIVRHKIDIIHSHRLSWSYVVVIPSLILNKPLIIHIVVIEKPKNILKNIIIKYMPNVTFIAVSVNARIQFLKLNSLNPKRIHVHYGGIYFPDIEKNQRIKIPFLEKLTNRGKLIIAMVSRMDPLKGVDVYVEAAGILAKKYPQLHFLHIGNHTNSTNEIDYFQMCNMRVANLGIKDRFTFIDYLDNVLPYFKYFYISALPSYKDTLAYVNIESNAFGVPAIFTNIDGIPESSIETDFTAIPFPPSPLILSERISELIKDKKKYNMLRNKVRQKVNKYFNAEKNAQHLNSIYRKLSGKN